MKKQYAVFGLGSFGRSVALTLESLGSDVIVVDKSYEKVQEISDSVSYAMRADVADPDALLSLGRTESGRSGGCGIGESGGQYYGHYCMQGDGDTLCTCQGEG